MKFLRPNLSLFLIVGLALLYACSDDTIRKVDPPPGPNPNPPPSKLCKPDFNYGYTNRVSYLPGETVTAYLHGKQVVVECALVVYDLKGDSIFAATSALQPQTIANNDPSRNGYGFTPSATFKIPADLESGIYLIEKTIPIVVKPQSSVDILVVYPTNTVNAYATSGGKSLYTSDRPNAV